MSHSLYLGKFLPECHLRPEWMWGDKEGGKLVESPLERWQPWAREPGRQGLGQGLCRVGEVGGGASWGETWNEWGVFPVFVALSVK